MIYDGSGAKYVKYYYCMWEIAKGQVNILK